MRARICILAHCLLRAVAFAVMWSIRKPEVLPVRRLLTDSLAALALVAITAAAQAGTACPEHFAAGQAPQVTNTRMQVRTRELCFAGFAVLHSGVTRTALYSAEHLTRQTVSAARDQIRVDPIPKRVCREANAPNWLTTRARGSTGGHLAPSGDASAPEAQAQTFTLANMVSQDPDNNRHLWAGIESAVRDLAQQRGELYVVTGPLFETASVKVLKQRVMVPTSLFKLVYDPRSGRAAAYVVPNDASGEYRAMDVAHLESRAGMRLLPDLDGVRSRSMLELPPPRNPRGGNRQRRSHPARAVPHTSHSLHTAGTMARWLTR
jgi:endonuclease G